MRAPGRGGGDSASQGARKFEEGCFNWVMKTKGAAQWAEKGEGFQIQGQGHRKKGSGTRAQDAGTIPCSEAAELGE